MRYMIDSHILAFVVSDQDELTREVKGIIEDYGDRIYVPSKCVEELMYMQQSGRISVRQWKSPEAVLSAIDDLGFGIKHTADEHLWTLARLPLFPDHKDPTDRVIIAQAITERTPLISSDRKFPLYVRHGLDLIFNKR